MRRQLPGLTAFRTFEAAARHRSFSRAAQELNVTPAAVSYLVRELEEQLKVQLFKRSGRGVGLTRAGEILRDSAAIALDDIERAIEQVRGLEHQDQSRINVSTTPSFAMKWLVPRLNRFLMRFPDVDVRVDMSRQLVDFTQGEMDLAIRFGTDRHPGLLADRLLRDHLFPVCTPRFLKTRPALRQPKDLRHFPLIHPDYDAHGTRWPTWDMWLEAAGVHGIDTKRGLHFNQSALAIQAAIDGQGVALADASLVEFDLAAGRLVRPFRQAVVTPEKLGYWIVMPARSRQNPIIDAFRLWLLQEAAAGSVMPEQPDVGQPDVGQIDVKHRNAPRAQRGRKRAAIKG
ncbi:MAG TPA: transcriptional regulator GcvA [Dongiaceae bacterium]|nr:transcriptional regulator GcvA [Dongiaceae bacterium]